MGWLFFPYTHSFHFYNFLIMIVPNGSLKVGTVGDLWWVWCNRLFDEIIREFLIKYVGIWLCRFLVNEFISLMKSRTVIKKREFLQDILNLKALPDNCNGAFDATDSMKLVEVIQVGLIMMMGDTSGIVLRVFICMSTAGHLSFKKSQYLFSSQYLCWHSPTASRRISIKWWIFQFRNFCMDYYLY